MSNEKVSQLPTVTSALASDIIYAIQGGVSVQETLQQVLNLSLTQTILNFAGNPNGNVAGSVYQLCWDKTNDIMYVCTTTGSTVTAVWTQIAPGSGGVIPPASGGTGVASPTAHTLPIAEGSSNFTFLGPLTNGQLLIGSTGNNPVPAVLTAGTNMSITNGAGSIILASTGSGSFSWTEVTGTSQAMTSFNGYIANNGSLVTLTLPTVSNVGDQISIAGLGAGGWSITYTTGQLIHVGNVASTITTGSVSSNNRYDSMNLVCTVANTTWNVLGGPQGNLTIV